MKNFNHAKTLRTQRKNGCFLTLLIAICYLLISCLDFPDKVNLPDAPEGMGYFTLSIDGLVIERTLVPQTQQSDFKAYSLRFIPADTAINSEFTAYKTNENLGEALPNWLGGFANTFSYKGLRLYALVDISQGGKVFSSSVREELLYGTIKKTLPGRDGTYVAEGMVATKDANGDWVSTGQKNTKQVTAQAYWNTAAFDKESFVSEEVVNDMSYIAMREISLSYSLPQRLFERSFIGSLSVGAYGRNLFYFQRKTEGFSPEACSYNVHNNGIGIESTALPMMRVFGFNVAISF